MFGSNVAPKRRLYVAADWTCLGCLTRNRKIMATCEACGRKRPKVGAESRA